MNPIEERVYGGRRLLNQRRQQTLTEQRAKRDPEKFKRILPAEALRRVKRGVR